ncbi:hypothetical protein ACFLZM_00530, partial [Thermodesulfobacteriota bacterium]
GSLNQNELVTEAEGFRKTYGPEANKFMRNEILGRLDLDGENDPLLILLNEFCDVDTDPFSTLFREYRDAVQTAAQKRNEEIKKILAEKRSISGSAVAPNLNKDNKWQVEHSHLHDVFSQVLTDHTTKLQTSN